MAHRLLPIYPSRTEVEQIADACLTPRDAMLVRLCFATGGRISEVLQTRVGDISAHGLRMPSLKQHQSAQKHVFLPDTFLAELRNYCTGMAATHPIIGHHLDPARPISRVQAWRIITAAGRRAGVLKQRYGALELRPPWPHSLRHGNAIHLLENGVGINAVSQQLGHASLQSTAVYLALSDPHRQAMLEKVRF